MGVPPRVVVCTLAATTATATTIHVPGAGHEGPVPVDFSLHAVVEDFAVRLTWLASGFVEYDGFHVYRGLSPAGPVTQLNQELLPHRGPYEYVDETVAASSTYWYRIGAVRGDFVEKSGPVMVETPDWRPLVTGLTRVRPNPFVGQSLVEFSLARRGPVRISIYDVSGRLIRTIVDGEYPAGEHTGRWDGTNAAGNRVTAGVYFARFEAGGHHQTRKAVFLAGR